MQRPNSFNEIICRYRRHWRKDIALTLGGLSDYGLTREKSAKVVVPGSNEPYRKNTDGLTSKGRTEHYVVSNEIRKLNTRVFSSQF